MGQTEQGDEQQLMENVLEICRQMVTCGSEVRRVEETIRRIAAAYGLELSCAYATTALILISWKGEEGAQIQAVRIEGTSLDLGKLERLNDRVRSICQLCPPVTDITNWIRQEEQHQDFQYLEFAGYVLTAFGFCIFFGGHLKEAVVAGLIAMLVYELNQKVSMRNTNRMVYTLGACFLAGMLAIFAAHAGTGIRSDQVMIGDVMLFIPGLAIVNGTKEMLYRDIMTGIIRLSEAVMIAIVIAAGFAAAILLFE